MTGGEPSRRDIFSLPLVLGLALGGCGPRVRQPGEIVVGSSATGVPYSFVDPWTNSFTGAMIDTVKAVTGALGLTPDFAITPFSALVPSLVGRKIDMIAAAMLRTPEREKIVAFSDPVFPYPAGLVVPRADHRAYPDLTALRGLRVGAQVGTRFVDQLHEAGVEDVKTYDGLADIVREVSFGRLDAGYGDEPILRYQLRVGPKRDARIVEGFRAPALEELCLVLRKDDPLLGRVNRAIALLRGREIVAIKRRWQLVDPA